MASLAGLTLLTTGSNASNTLVDIVFVHGLGEHPVKTWTTSRAHSGRGVCWPVEFLQKDLPSARLLTFGWSPKGDVRRDKAALRAFIRDENAINGPAEELVIGLERWRRAESQESRPIIFVAHSIGGLIVKRAFFRSYFYRGNATVRKISHSTRGFLFLATPHSVAPALSSAKLLKRIATLSERVGRISNEEAMGAALSVSRILDDFKWLVQDQHLAKIVSFYEELPMVGQERPIVSKEETELLEYPQIPLYADHQSICTFKSTADPNYKQVVGSLKILFGFSPRRERLRPPLRQREEELLQSLQIGDRRRDIARAADGTCSWIFGNESFKEWQSQPSGILWLQGMPGSGKTVLSHYLVQELNKPDGFQRKDTLVADHFLSFTGDMNQRNLRGLFQSLLGQILVRLPYALTPDLPHQYRQKREMLGIPGRDWFWGIEELLEYLEKAISKVASTYRIIFIIDALDEGEDVEPTLNHFNHLALRLGSKSPFHVCISSRFDSSLKQVPEIRLQDHNQPDLARYVEAQLQFDNDTRRQPLIKDIVDKASGVFLWVKLVVSQLTRVTEYSEDIGTIGLPTDLNMAYETIVSRINNDADQVRRSFVQRLLILVAFSLRPLSVRELCSALGCPDCPKCSKVGDQPAGVSPGIEAASCGPRKSPAKFVREVSWGLLEVRSTSKGLEDDSCSAVGSLTVSFVHWTAQTWIQQEGVRLLRMGASVKIYHGEIARICLDYLTNHDFGNLIPKGKDELSAALPFTEYATLYMLRHLQLAGTKAAEPLERCREYHMSLSQKHLDRWIDLYSLYSGDRRSFKSGTTTALHVAAHFDVPLLEGFVRETFSVTVNCQDHVGRTPLSHAAQNGHVDFCRSLIDRGADNKVRDAIYGQTPLHWAARAGKDEVVELLLSIGADANDCTGGSSPLHLACAYGHQETVRRLLRMKADPNRRDAYSGLSATSLSAAFGFGNIVALCREYGATTYVSEMFNEWTALHCAVSTGRVEIAGQLLKDIGYNDICQRQAKSDQRGNNNPSWIVRVVEGITRMHPAYDSKCSHTSGDSTNAPSPSSSSMFGSGGGNGSGNLFGSGTVQQLPSKGGGLAPEDDDPDGEDGKSKKPRRTPPEKQPRYRFACPFYKANPHLHSIHPCRGPEGWPTIARLKEHLYKKHARYRCGRCQALFLKRDSLADHLQSDSLCVKRGRNEIEDYYEGFDEDQLKELKPRTMKRATESKSEIEYWTAIFRILFPKWVGEVPKPFYEYDQPSVITAFHNFCVRERQTDGQLREQLQQIAPGANIDQILQVIGEFNHGLAQRWQTERVDGNDQPDATPQPGPSIPSPTIPTPNIMVTPPDSSLSGSRSGQQNVQFQPMIPDLTSIFPRPVPSLSQQTVTSDSGVYIPPYPLSNYQQPPPHQNTGSMFAPDDFLAGQPLDVSFQGSDDSWDPIYTSLPAQDPSQPLAAQQPRGMASSAASFAPPMVDAYNVIQDVNRHFPRTSRKRPTNFS